MANQFVSLPAPAGNGAGAAVDVSTFGALKTIVVGGNARATINIEINNAAVATDGSWAPIASFQNTGQLTLRVAARWMRVRVSGYNPYVGGTPDVNVGGTDDGAQFASLTVPTGNGSGPSVNVSALGNFKSVQVGGDFRGALIVEVSEDGTDWGQPFGFQIPGVQSQVVAAKFMRVTRVGVPQVSPGQPIVNVGATDDFQGDDGVAISAGTQSVATGTVLFADSNGISFGMSASSRVTASMDAFRSVIGGTSTATGPTLSFANSNGVSFGVSGQTVTGSVAPSPLALSAGTQSANTGTIVFSNSNNVSFGMAGSSQITASVSQTPETPFGISAGTQSVSTGTLAFANSNGIGFGMSGSSQVTASFDGMRALTAGTTNTSAFSGLSFSNGSNVTFGLTGATLTASVQNAGILAEGAGTQTATSGTINFANSNGITFGMSGSSQITASYPSYVSLFQGAQAMPVSWGVSINTLWLWPVSCAEHISATGVVVPVSMNLNSNSTGAWSHSFGIYTLSGVTASLASSASQQFSFTSGSDTTASNIFAGASGQRYRLITGNFNLTPGLYLFAEHIQTSGGNSVSLSRFGEGGQWVAGGTYQGIETANWAFGISNSSFTSAMPASIAATNTNYQRTGVGVRIPAFFMYGTT